MPKQKKSSPRAARATNILPPQIVDALENGKPFVLHIDGSITTLNLSRDSGVRLEQLQRVVGGYIELIPCAIPRWKLIANEDGNQKKLPPNELATKHAYGLRLFSDRVIVGSVVLIPANRL